MSFNIKLFNEIMARFDKTALYLAVEKENVEIVKLLMTNEKIDPNIICILQSNYIKFNIKSFNLIQYQIIQWNSISNHSI